MKITKLLFVVLLIFTSSVQLTHADNILDDMSDSEVLESMAFIPAAYSALYIDADDLEVQDFEKFFNRLIDVVQATDSNEVVVGKMTADFNRAIVIHRVLVPVYNLILNNPAVDRHQKLVVGALITRVLTERSFDYIKSVYGYEDFINWSLKDLDGPGAEFAERLNADLGI